MAISRRLALLAAAAVPAAAAESPEAELVRLCDEYVATLQAYNSDADGPDGDDNPLWRRLSELRDQIHETPATTIEGVIGKARIAEIWATQPDGGLDFSKSFTGDWPEQVIMDLLAIYEGQQA